MSIELHIEGASDITIAGSAKVFTEENAPVAKSVEGYVMIMSNLHPETTEDHIFDVFEEYVRVSNLHLNMDKRTGYCKGYALIEFKDIEDAAEIMEIHREESLTILGRKIELDYAFVNSEEKDISRFKSKGYQSREVRSRLSGNNNRDRSPSRV